MEKNQKMKPIDSSIENKKIVFCYGLPFAILSFNNYLNIESMNFISSDVQTNEYELFNIKSSDFMYAFKKLGILNYLELWVFRILGGFKRNFWFRIRTIHSFYGL